MKALLVFVLLGQLAADTGLAAESTNVAGRHYVQVIRGSDHAAAPAPGATLVGLKVRQQLEPVFRWKNYWEVQRACVGVEPGKVGRVELVDGHSLEIDLRNVEKRTIRLFRGNKQVRSAVCRRDKDFCIQGIESADRTVWFIVVRTDPPAT